MKLVIRVVEVENGYVILSDDYGHRPGAAEGYKWVAKDIPTLMELVGELANDVKKGRGE